MSRSLPHIALVLGLLLAPAANAGSPVYPLLNPGQHSLDNLPGCDASSLAFRIKYRFNTTQMRYWDTDLRMDEVNMSAHMLGERPNTQGLIARRWCQGTARFNDGKLRRVQVELASDMSITGMTYSIHTCVDGLDMHSTYAPSCRVLRPRDF
jgi:hypothetical protein